MVAAGFDVVFIGIETPHAQSLVECSKFQNQNRNLVSSVKKLQAMGLEIQGGFIVGFDSDDESIFERQRQFIERAAIAASSRPSPSTAGRS